MATYYVGPGGNDGSAGTSWALRKLTLNGAEDIPVAANDTVYVGPGCYREQLTVDVSGGAGTEITYIADVTGENTDGVGGIVRITGSDNDQTPARQHCIEGDNKHYRVFRGFLLDMHNFEGIHLTSSCTNWTFEDSFFNPGGRESIEIAGNSTTDINVLRCMFIPRAGYYGVFFDVLSQNAASLVENCMFAGSYGYAIRLNGTGGVTARNCSFLGMYYAMYQAANPPGGYTACVVNNSIIQCCRIGVSAQAVGEIVENHNAFYGNSTDRVNVNVGANSVAYPALLTPPVLFSGAGQASGYKFPWWFGGLSEWSQIRAITGSNEPGVDLHSIGRPATASKNSWGAVQWQGGERDTATTYDASTASVELPDAGRVQFKIPVNGTEITVSAQVYREANYAGTNPQMVIKQPGQADRTTTDAGAAGAWNELTDTFTPAADPEYIFVELVSNNTAAAGNYATYFDSLAVNTSPSLGTFDEWFTDRIMFDEVAAPGVAAPIIAPSTIVR